MEQPRYLIDTNTVIDYLGKKLPSTTKWLNMNNHRCNLWNEIAPMTETLKVFNIN